MLRRIPTARSRRRGIVVLDTFIGLVLLSGMLGLLVASISQQRKTAKTFASQREAVRELERVAFGLNAGQAVGARGVAIEPAGDGWVRLTYDRDGLRVELLAPLADGVTP